MAEAGRDLKQRERELDYAHVDDVETPGLRYVFVRLVPRVEDAEGLVANTLVADEAHVDVDAEGNVIGVTVFLR